MIYFFSFLIIPNTEFYNGRTLFCFSNERIDRLNKLYPTCTRLGDFLSLPGGHIHACEICSYEVLPTYSAWYDLRSRCHPKSEISTSYYSRKNVGMSQEWRESFHNFYKDLGLRPSSLHVLKRRNTKLGFSKENCIWAIRQGKSQDTGKIRSESPEYRAWDAMCRRCTNENHKSYANYGGRGIKVHPEWLGQGGFDSFLDYVGPRPGPGFSLDRINNDGNYEPGNLRWTTWEVQANNTRATRYVTYNGNKISIRQLHRETGITYPTLLRRFTEGKSVEEITSPPRPYNKSR